MNKYSREQQRFFDKIILEGKYYERLESERICSKKNVTVKKICNNY